MGMMEAVIEIPAEHAKNLFGQFDVFAKKIERALHVTLIARDESVKILGDAAQVELGQKCPLTASGAVPEGECDPGAERRLYPGACHGRPGGLRTGD